MKHDKSKKVSTQTKEHDIKAGIREKLLSFSLDQKLNLGIVAREPSIPDTAVDVSQYIRLFADGIVVDMFGSADARIAATKKLSALGISLMYTKTETRMQQEIVDKLERTPFSMLLSAGVFGEALTEEMAEKNLQLLVDWQYQDMMGGETN